MEFLANDLSINGQFPDIATFQASLRQVMLIRQRILAHGYSLFCHRNMASAKVTPDAVMQQAVNLLKEGERRALLQWLTQSGPHWEDHRVHTQNDYVEVGPDLVTDSAVAEAAICVANGQKRELLSFQPSKWQNTPVNVKWTQDDNSCRFVDVTNHWELNSVEQSLGAQPRPAQSWKDLNDRSKTLFERIVFSNDAYSSLEGSPFVPGAANRILERLGVLNRLCGCFDADQKLNEVGLEILGEHFVGEKAWFSDSSADEKIVFKNELTFKHPADPEKKLFCTWHGKVKTPQIRIHFTWPVPKGVPLYVVYVGMKLTKT